MAEETDLNQIDSGRRGRSMRKGDVPDLIRRRYYLDERGGQGLGFYTDARVPAPAFRDLGAKLISRRADPNAIRDMVNVAQHRSWTRVLVRGEPAFRREAWLAAMALGIEARGYAPTDRDRQELQRRLGQPSGKARPELAETDRRRRDDASPLAVVEAVVRTRIQDRLAQERILETARERIASWLERGASLQPLELVVAKAPRRSGRER